MCKRYCGGKIPEEKSEGSFDLESTIKKMEKTMETYELNKMAEACISSVHDVNKYLTDLNFSQDLINNQKKTDEIKKSFLKRELGNKEKNNKKRSSKLLQFIKIYQTRTLIFKEKETKSKIDELRNILELSISFAKNLENGGSPPLSPKDFKKIEEIKKM